jgi:hypothetical protein
MASVQRLLRAIRKAINAGDRLYFVPEDWTALEAGYSKAPS